MGDLGGMGLSKILDMESLFSEVADIFRKGKRGGLI